MCALYSAHIFLPTSPASQQLQYNYGQWNAIGSPDDGHKGAVDILEKCVLCVVHTFSYPTLQHHNSYSRIDKYGQWNAGGSPDDGYKDVVDVLVKCVHYTVYTFFYPTLQYHNSYNRIDNYRQWKAVGSPDVGHKDARNTLRYYRLPINHYLLHLVGLTFTYNMCVLISLQLFSETFLILGRSERDVIENVFGLHVKYRLLLSVCN